MENEIYEQGSSSMSSWESDEQNLPSTDYWDNFPPMDYYFEENSSQNELVNDVEVNNTVEVIDDADELESSNVKTEENPLLSKFDDKGDSVNIDNLMENQDLKTLINILNNYNKKDESHIIETLVEAVYSMEQSLNNVMEELKSYKEQESNKDDEIIENIEKDIGKTKNTIDNVKKDIINISKDIIGNFKNIGEKALNKSNEIFRVRDSLLMIKKALQSNIYNTDQNISKFTNINTEVKQINNHILNIGRTMLGKDMKEVDIETGKPPKSLINIRKILTKMEEKNINSIKKVENLSERANAKKSKKSVLSKLNKVKKNIGKVEEVKEKVVDTTKSNER